MKKVIFFIFILANVSTFTFAQIKTPEKRAFNVGIFDGVGGVNFTLVPGLDFQFKGNILKVAPSYRAFAIGYSREILPISKVFYNWYWIGSLYGGFAKEDDVHPAVIPGTNTPTSITTTFQRAALLTGARFYFAKRWFSQFQAGALYEIDKTPGRSNTSSVIPYFEFCLGVNLYKSYLKEEDELNE
jgi:hypothetical protein